MSTAEAEVAREAQESEDRDEAMERAAQALKEILAHVCDCSRGISTRRIAARAIALALIIDPEIVGNRSRLEIERATRRAVRQPQLSQIARQMRRAFGLRGGSAYAPHPPVKGIFLPAARAGDAQGAVFSCVNP